MKVNDLFCFWNAIDFPPVILMQKLHIRKKVSEYWLNSYDILRHFEYTASL